jgi:phage shock protein PspC (stress-responsive transcriptional regulator)
VCVGLARVTRVSAGWIRAAFVLGALAGGLGIALYLACWLIIPVQGEGDESTVASGVVVLAQACAVAVGLAVLAGLAAVATVFGLGWVVVGVAAAVLVGVLLGQPRRGPAWALLPVAALTLPALGVAADGLRLTTHVHPVTVAPVGVQALGHDVYHSGLNTMLVDLRHTTLPVTGTVPLRIDAGLRRTIVALPSERCVRVVVHYDVDPLAVRLTALLAGHAMVFSDAVIFGQLYDHTHGSVTPPASEPGPVLDIDFSSQGGSLYVRDYPDAVDPTMEPDWPGYRVHLEPRPDIRGTPKKAAEGLIRHWKARLAAQESNAQTVNSLMRGPCDPPAVARRVPRRRR